MLLIPHSFNTFYISIGGIMTKSFSRFIMIFIISVSVILTCSLNQLSAKTLKPVKRGHLVLIGGGSKPLPVMNKFVELSGGKNANILIFPTASGEPDTGEYYINLFKEQLHCKNIKIIDIKSRKDSSNPQYINLIRNAGGIFFSGGDQSKITKALLDTPAKKELDLFFSNGGVIGGTSAGTACMSSIMLTGEGNKTVIRKHNIKLVPGMSYFPGVIVDQHFVARKRQNRLINAILDNPLMIGVGIEEATAVWLKPDLEMSILGEGWVFIYDAYSAKINKRKTKNKETNLGVTNMKLHILQSGNVYDLKTRIIK